MIQLQSVLLPSQEICAISELYYHIADERIDFNGYFNLFYIEKRKKYTRIDNLFLSISLQGYNKLILVHDGIDIKSISLEAEEYKLYQIELPYMAKDGGVFWFALIEDQAIRQRKVQGWFATDMPEEFYRKINIAIDICTYRRENYIVRNLKQLRDSILKNGDLDVSEHVKIFIVDNGRTLCTCEPVQEIVTSCDGKVIVVANKNAGGAGGFTRGMLEILKEKEDECFTHILLMDDDAIVEPDTLVRIYGLLSTLKPEWAEMTIGGAMLREDYQYILFCAGEWWDCGTIINPEMHLDLRDLKQAVSPYLTSVGHEYDRYSGWWCCCYSLNVVREDNLPIPLFIHHDDIEFGLRNSGKGIVFLNGVGVWHRGPESTFSGSNTYYDIRNNLIEIALHQKSHPLLIAEKWIFIFLTLAAIRLRYKDADMVFRGLKDFLKGPEWLYVQEPDQLNADIRNMACSLVPLEELKKNLSKEESEEVERQILKYKSKFGINEIVDSRARKSKVTLWQLITYNGCFLPGKQNIKVILPTDSPFEAYRRKKVVLYEWGSGRGAILKKDYKALLRIWGYYVRALLLLIFQFKAVSRNYKENIASITNFEAWEEYLKRR